MRGGYYSGANLDYEIEEDCYFNEDEHKTRKTIDNKIQSTVNRLKKTLETFGTKLICQGVFSNGEAVYKKA